MPDKIKPQRLDLYTHRANQVFRFSFNFFLASIIFPLVLEASRSIAAGKEIQSAQITEKQLLSPLSELSLFSTVVSGSLAFILSKYNSKNNPTKLIELYNLKKQFTQNTNIEYSELCRNFGSEIIYFLKIYSYFKNKTKDNYIEHNRKISHKSDVFYQLCFTKLLIYINKKDRSLNDKTRLYQFFNKIYEYLEKR